MSPKEAVSSHDITKRLTSSIGLFTLGNRNKIFFISAILALMSVAGVFQLQVDNRFIDYFKKDTEIYQGMSVIDTQLGGTTPLSIIIDAEKDFFTYLKEVEKDRLAIDLSDDPFSEVEEYEEENYWFKFFYMIRYIFIKVMLKIIMIKTYINCSYFWNVLLQYIKAIKVIICNIVFFCNFWAYI